MGLPLQIFGKGSMFGPYTPLQQLDLLADDGTKSYVLDEDSINISSLPLRTALTLSVADRRWIDLLTQIVNDTWDEAHPSRPKTLGFMGSEEFIRLQFEEYLLALLSCMKYHEELNSYTSGDSPHRGRAQLQTFNIEGDPALDFNVEFLTQWQKTSNYALFSKLTSDALLFSITEPRHPSAGGLTMEDVQRRLSQQVADLHLDERVREGREALNRHLSTGQKKVSAAFNSFWSDIESMREAQRKRNEEKASQSQRTSLDKEGQGPGSPPPQPAPDSPSETSGSWFSPRQRPSIDVTQAQASVSAASQKAGAYFSSWGSWASDKRREWQDKRTSSPAPTPNPGMTASPSTPVLPTVSETVFDSDRGRRRSMHRHSEDGEGLSRSLSRRKRWSNIILRRESGEFKREESDAADMPFPKSPLSQGFTEYGTEAEKKKHDLTAQDKPLPEPRTDDDGFTSVSLTPSEGLRVDLNPEKNKSVHDAATVLPVKHEEQHPSESTEDSVKESVSTQ
ncbi:Late secretory pathway protein AVL9 [Penicillium subrubescens]|uniref:Late secretory pathway protein AVL9 n=1 Tax=Penicillium subrubescens TaxID=1316194 RepID=A0A1Q5TBZ1_9EURO|nr:Late secretory pathway protein AVL9 [Penicillium subrubescens]